MLALVVLLALVDWFALISRCAEHWEMQIAALLLWVLRLPEGQPLGQFWRQYVRLIPPIQQQTSLLLWSQQELEELQVEICRTADTSAGSR